MLAYVPVVFDVYRPLKPHLRWTMQCLVSFADRTGRCFPSVRKLGEVADISKSTVSRHLAELEKAGALSRRRRPGSVYEYRIDSRFLPAASKAMPLSPKATERPAAELSHPRKWAVPPVRTEEKLFKKTDSAMPDDRAQWRARVRSWQKSRFWLPQWGPKPNQPGCFAPVAVVSATMGV